MSFHVDEVAGETDETDENGSEVSDGQEENRIGYECKLDLIELDSYVAIKASPESLA